MEAEAPLVRVERRERRGAARVRDPRPRRDRLRGVGDRAVGDAQQDEVRVVLGHAVAQPGGNRRADAAKADDLNFLDHKSSSSVADTGQVEVYRGPFERPPPCVRIYA